MHKKQTVSAPFKKSTLLLAALYSALSLMASDASLAEEQPFKPSKVESGKITLNFDAITTDTWDNQAQDRGGLWVLDGDVDGTKIVWWEESKPEDEKGLYGVEGIDSYDQNHVEFTVTNSEESGGFNFGWDFENVASDINSVFAFFRNTMMDKDSPDRWLKHFIFDGTTGKINVISQNVLVKSTNSGDSQAAIGLSITNKRGWMTFNDETYLVSDFAFGSNSSGGEVSGTSKQFIVAGVYTSFGANKDIYGQIFQQDGSLKLQEGVAIDKYGLTEFNGRAVISVTAKPSSKGQESDLLNEVFGVFSNEGGSIALKSGGDIVVKGRDKHHLVSAIASASTLGILDPFKQGKIDIQAGNDGKVNRIWAWSDNYDADSPITVTGNNELFNDEGKLSSDIFSNLAKQFEDYLQKATELENQTLRSSVIAANGSTVTISDEGKSGYFDIRGDVISGVKNGDDAQSNTIVNSEKKKPADGKNYSVAGTVTRSNVTINLTNSRSTLVGNVYERHRIGDEEAIILPEDNNSTQTFKDWAQYQLKQEAATLGGTVDLELSNQATWYPTKQWGGWNFDLLYRGYFIGTDNKVINEDYKLYDAADQYNLHVWEDNGYKVTNNTYLIENAGEATAGEAEYDDTKINDLDLLVNPTDTIETAYQKGEGYRVVDNGIYHLKLNGGIVDLSYLRQDFQMSTDQDELGLVDDNTEYTGIKKFRIQALSGTNGTVRMFARDDDNHDLVIIDEMRGADNQLLPNSDFNLNLVFWNDSLDNNKLTIDPNDSESYIYVARVPEQVNVTATGYGQGRTTYTFYKVEKDKKEDGSYGEGSWTYGQQLDWHSKNDNWFVTGEEKQIADPAVVDTTELSANIGYLMATTVETLRDRRGEMVLNGTQDDGFWIRYTHNRFGQKGLTLETDGFQMGYEYAEQKQEARLFRGVAFDVAQGEADYSRLTGDSDINRYRISAYQTYIHDNGFYYDLVGRAGWYDVDTQVAYTRDDLTSYDVKSDFGYWAAAASFETGWRFESDNGWWIEPETQLQYTYINDYDYGTNQGIKINASDTDSLIGRVGFRAGKVLLSEKKRKMSVWVGSDLLHEWLGDQKGTMTGVDQTIKYDISGSDTWYNAVFGMSWETGSDSRFWVDAKHNFGGDKDDNWTVNAGLTWNF
mgnify:CR=1 FL=1